MRLGARQINDFSPSLLERWADRLPQLEALYLVRPLYGRFIQRCAFFEVMTDHVRTGAPSFLPMKTLARSNQNK